jgi:flagellar basal body-associated protein FliL
MSETAWSSVMTPEEQKKANVKLALILLTVVLVFFAGFMARMAWMGH